jgi:hypothetical protein
VTTNVREEKSNHSENLVKTFSMNKNSIPKFSSKQKLSKSSLKNISGTVMSSGGESFYKN